MSMRNYAARILAAGALAAAGALRADRRNGHGDEHHRKHGRDTAPRRPDRHVSSEETRTGASGTVSGSPTGQSGTGATGSSTVGTGTSTDTNTGVMSGENEGKVAHHRNVDRQFGHYRIVDQHDAEQHHRFQHLGARWVQPRCGRRQPAVDRTQHQQLRQARRTTRTIQTIRSSVPVEASGPVCGRSAGPEVSCSCSLRSSPPVPSR